MEWIPAFTMHNPKPSKVLVVGVHNCLGDEFSEFSCPRRLNKEAVELV